MIENKLTNQINDDINDFKNIGYNSKKDYLEDIIKNGCVNGAVSSLIYYKDTTDFYLKYQNEINDTITEMVEVFDGDDVRDILGKNYDYTDSLFLHRYNRNAIVWAVYEYVCSQLLEQERSKIGRK